MSEPLKKPNPAPAGYSPKGMPEILKLAEEARKMNATTQPAVKAAPSRIRPRARNAVRIVELPACKMVSSGRCGWDKAFGPDGPLTRFGEWFGAFGRAYTARLLASEFMWGPTSGEWVEWAYAVEELSKAADGSVDTGGFEVIDFPGGLFAVAVSVDADGRDHNRVHSGIQKWVKKSGCFALDETDRRFSMGHIASPPQAREAMGYHQMDLYFPIRIKGENEK